MSGLAILAAIVAVMSSLLGGAGIVDDADESVLSPELARLLSTSAADVPINVIVGTQGPSSEWTDEASLLGVNVIWTYQLIPAFSAVAPAAKIEALAEQDWVTGMSLDRPVTTLMDASTGDIEANKAWDAGYTGVGITVAVLDTGVDLIEPGLDEAIVSCVSTILGLTVPECTDTNGHGTHVAGTVAGRHATYRGVAPDANLAIVRVLHAGGAGTSADIIAGMDWIAENKDRVSPPIRVATMSIGFADPGCGDGSGPEAEAADALVARGVSFTIAAGNSGHAKCTIDGASAAFNVITVGAADDRNTKDPSDDTLAEFSSGGPTDDGRLKPELVAPGVNIQSLFLGPTTKQLSGTSMATPHVAGAIAVLLQKEPSLTPEEVKARLVGSTVVPDAAPNLPDNDWGHGLLNVCAALQMAGCATGSNSTVSEPTVVGHVDSISMSFKHQGDKHVLQTYVYIVDAAGRRLPDVKVFADITSPEGTVYPRSATTDETGRARMQVTQSGGGHGEWEACVTDLSVPYDASANRETCETLTVT